MLENFTNQPMPSSAKKRRARRSTEEWRQLIIAYDQGTLEKIAFCKEHNIRHGSN